MGTRSWHPDDHAVDRRGHSPGANAFRPAVLQNRYFVSAYLRFAATLLVLSGVVTLVASKVVTITRPVYINLPADPPEIPSHVVDQISTPAFPYYPRDATLLEGFLGVLDVVFTSGPVLLVLVLGGALAAVLEYRIGS